MELTDDQKAIIHDAIDEMHDRLLETRADVIEHDHARLTEHDEYTEQVGDLLALDWGPA